MFSLAVLLSAHAIPVKALLDQRDGSSNGAVKKIIGRVDLVGVVSCAPLVGSFLFIYLQEGGVFSLSA